MFSTDRLTVTNKFLILKTLKMHSTKMHSRGGGAVRRKEWSYAADS